MNEGRSDFVVSSNSICQNMILADATIQVLDISQSANQFEKFHVPSNNPLLNHFRHYEQPGDQTAAPGQAAPEVSCGPQLRPPEDGLQ